MKKKSRKLFLFFTKSLTFNTFLESMAIALKNKYEVSLCSSDVEKINNYDFKKHSFYFPVSLKDFLNIKKIIKTFININKFINKSNNDLFFCHTPVASHFIRLATFFKRPKIIYFVHGFRFNDSRNFFLNFFFKLIERILSFNTLSYITINKSDYYFVKNILKKPVIKVNGVGIEKKKIIKKNKNKGFFTIGMIGSYKINKGYELIIENYDKIKKIIPNLRIETYGAENPNKLKSLIRQKKINHFQLNKFEKNIINKLINFDILLHPSYREGLSVSIMQALQYGVPVIARNIVGNKDLIRNNYNGYLFNNNIEMLNYLNRIFSNEILKKKLSKNASKSINYKFLNNSINEKIKKFINKF